MFNILRRGPSPGRQDDHDHSLGNALAAEDIRRILQVFKISDLSDDQDLILSDNALIKPAACIAAIKAECDSGTGEDGSLPLLTFQGTGQLDLRRSALQFGLEAEALRKLLERDGSRFVFSQNHDSVLSRYLPPKRLNEL
jgi:hypothetical protein